MAYAAVISLKQTIHRLLNSSRISIVSASQGTLKFAYKELNSLQKVLKRLDDSSSNKRLDALDEKIKDAVHKLEDALEFHKSDQLLSQSSSQSLHKGSSHIISIDLKEVRQEIKAFVETTKKIKDDYIIELDNPSPEEEEDDDAAASSSIDFDAEMVGLSDDLTTVKNLLLRRKRPDDFGVFSFVGMAGTGRTIAAKTIFEDLYIHQEQFFDCGAWVTIGSNYQFKEIVRSILAQIDDRASNDELLMSEGDEKMAEYLCSSLKGRRYMIVLDDIWDTKIWEYLRRSFPEQSNGSLVLLTTGLNEVAQFANSFYIYELSANDEDGFWHTLRLIMFGEELCPPELEEAGKKIVENCKGRRIVFAKVILFLLTTPRLKYWNKLAAHKENSFFMVTDEISEMCKLNEGLQQLSLRGDFPTQIIKLAKALLDLSDLIERIKIQMFPKRFFTKMETFSFYGMAGIGKTTFVKEIFEDPLISCCFDHRVWVTLGLKYKSEEILVDILAQIYPDVDKMHMKRDAKLTKDLCKRLSEKRCLIVLDDIWNKDVLHCLKKLFPNIEGEVLLTSRLGELAKLGDRLWKMRFLDKEESWCLLRQKVFVKELCPPEFEKAGKKIAENCRGLPLMIVTIANILSKVEKTPKHWNKVAEKENSIIMMNAHNEMSKTLLPSYKTLPQYLKPCFLYMGVFPQNHEVPTFKLIKLWIAEGFLEPNPSQNIKDFAAKCLWELVERTLVMVHYRGSDLETKTCSLHSVFWHLCNNEAVKNKFFHALNIHDDNSKEDIKSQRRVCIRNSILFDIKDMNTMASISIVRSLLCTGPPHKYPVPIYFGLRLLRVLDALTIRLYEFPIEVLKLVYLRYLALTCNGKLPTSISELWNLQYLIVNRHLSIKSYGDSSCVPVEIWDMKELKHLQIMGSNLPNPNRGADLLPNLLTLLNVSAHNCTRGVLKRIPSLKNLGVEIELSPFDDGKHFHFLNDISGLSKLESLKCVIVNPELRSEIVAPPVPLSMFPLGLRKLSLSGLGYPWEYMSLISSLPNLEVLKLTCYAFRGPEWETGMEDFMKLRFLFIEDTDLVRWKVKFMSLYNLGHVSIKHCYKLQELPWVLQVGKIEVVDCNPSVTSWARQIAEKNMNNPFTFENFSVGFHSSWDAGNLK